MIDFTALFAKQEIERLEFRTRRDVNYLHDIIFLSSYLDFATFNPQDFRLNGQQVVIDLDRVCWEFVTGIHGVHIKLPSCKSRLTIWGIDSIEWSAPQPTAPHAWAVIAPQSTGELFIRTVFIGERQHTERDTTAHLVILPLFSALRIDLVGSDRFFEIELIDQEDPHL